MTSRSGKFMKLDKIKCWRVYGSKLLLRVKICPTNLKDNFTKCSTILKLSFKLIPGNIFS